MIIEIVTISVSAGIIFLIYFARIKSGRSKTFLFSESFLHKTDEKIFDIVKFVFKMYSLLFSNISVFISKIPHKVVNSIHKISHFLAQKSSEWVDKITHKNSK
jgi:hypothetical protein